MIIERDVCGVPINLNSRAAEPMEEPHSRPTRQKLAGLALLWRLRICRSRCTRGAWLHPGLDVGDSEAQALCFSLSTSPRVNSFQHLATTPMQWSASIRATCQ